MRKMILGLQFFADAGALVNTTQNYANAYDPSQAQSFNPPDTLSPEMKVFYDTALLENARDKLVYAQFAKRQPLPKNHGKQVEWRKFNTFKKASQLIEGVIPTGQKMGLVTITGAIDQFGTYTSISDRLELRGYDPIIMVATEEMGASGARTQEELIRDALFAGTNVLYCDKIKASDGSKSAVAAQSDLVDDASYSCRMTDDMVLKMRTIMRKNKAPTINGWYVAVIHPSVEEDLRRCKGWREAHMYAQPEEIYKDEIGELHGIRFISSENAPVFKGAPLSDENRVLKLATATTSGTPVTTLVFNASDTVAANALKDRYISLNGKVVKVVSNTASSGTHTITIASTDFGSCAVGSEIKPADFGAGDIAAYATYVFGADSFGIIDPEAGGMEMIVKSREQAGGPLNQFSTVGYKFESNGATILYEERLLRVMSTSSYSDTDEAN